MKRLAVLVFLTFFAGVLLAQEEEKSAAFFKKQGSEAFNAKDFQGAYNAFIKAIEKGKQEDNLDTTLFFNAAVSAYRSRNIEKAIEYFGKAGKYGVHGKKSYLFKYKIEKKAKKNEQADSTLKHAYNKYPDNKKIAYYYNYNKGVDLYKKGAQRIQAVSDLKESEKEKEINKYNNEVEKANDTFREALPYLEKAYKAQKSTKVTKILSNIYSNLVNSDKTTAETKKEYKKKAKQLQARLEKTTEE